MPPRRIISLSSPPLPTTKMAEDVGVDAEARLTICYISRERDQEFNSERHAEARENRTCCSVRSWKDRLIDMYSNRQENTHVEVAFPLNALTQAQRQAYGVRVPKGVSIEECVLAFGAFSNKGVVATARPFSNPGYRFIHVAVRRVEFTRALNFALKQNKKPYDSAGASWRLMVWPSPPTYKRWWCASLTHAILKKVGMLRHYMLNSLDVDDIVKLVKHSGRRRQAMTPRGLNLAKTSVAEKFFGAYPARSIAGEIVTDVADAVEASCRQVATASPLPKKDEKKKNTRRGLVITTRR